MQLQPPRLGLWHPSLPHVVYGLLVEPSDGCTVAAPHVIGINFKLRTGVNMRSISKLQILAALCSIGKLRTACDVDQAVERSGCRPRGDTFNELATHTSGR